MLTYTHKLVKANFVPIQILIPAPAGIKTANLLSCAHRTVPDLPDRLAAYTAAFAKRGVRCRSKVRACVSDGMTILELFAG